jgi:hypothetical protein
MGMIVTPSNLWSIRYEWATETQSHLGLAEHGFTAGVAAARRRVERLCGSVTLWQERVCTLRIW